VGGEGGARREGRASQAVARPVLRQRWRGARPGSGWDRVDRRRVRSRPAPPHSPRTHSSVLLSHSSEPQAQERNDTDLRRRGPPPRLPSSLQRRGDNRPRPCAPLRSNGCPLSTRGRSTRWSAGGLTYSKIGAITHLPVGFPLRCAQRFSHPDVATRRCCFGNNRHTSGRSNPVLSY